MNTQYCEKPQEVLIPITTTVGTISDFCVKAKSKNMTLGEYVLYAVEQANRSSDEKAEKELASSEIKPTSK